MENASREGPPAAKPAWSEGQKRAVLSSFANLNNRMDEMLAALERSDPASPFARLENDLSAAEMQIVRDGFTRLRQMMLAQLQEAGIVQDGRRSSLRWAIRVNLTYMLVALADLSVKNLSAYGSLDPAAEAAILRMQQTLTELVQQLEAVIESAVT